MHRNTGLLFHSMDAADKLLAVGRHVPVLVKTGVNRGLVAVSVQ